MRGWFGPQQGGPYALVELDVGQPVLHSEARSHAAFCNPQVTTSVPSHLHMNEKYSIVQLRWCLSQIRTRDEVDVLPADAVVAHLLQHAGHALLALQAGPAG